MAKRSVNFTGTRRTQQRKTTATGLLSVMRFVGMSDDEIKETLTDNTSGPQPPQDSRGERPLRLSADQHTGGGAGRSRLLDRK